MISCHIERVDHEMDRLAHTTKPSIAVGRAAAPLSLRDMIVKMDPNLLSCQLCSNGIENLDYGNQQTVSPSQNRNVPLA